MRCIYPHLLTAATIPGETVDLAEPNNLIYPRRIYAVYFSSRMADEETESSEDVFYLRISVCMKPLHIQPVFTTTQKCQIIPKIRLSYRSESRIRSSDLVLLHLSRISRAHTCISSAPYHLV